MFERRGQLALFLLLGVVVLLAMVFLFMVPGLVPNRTASPCDGIETHVATRLGDALDHCLREVGLGGGEVDPKGGYDLAGHNILLAYDDGPEFLTAAQLDRNIEVCVEHTASYCLDSLDAFLDRGCTVDLGNPSADALLAREDVSLTVALNLTADERHLDRFAPRAREVRLAHGSGRGGDRLYPHARDRTGHRHHRRAIHRTGDGGVPEGGDREGRGNR